MENPPTLPTPATSEEKNLGILMHVLSLFGFSLIGPLIVWLIKKDESSFIRAQGAELLNFQLTMLIFAFVGLVLCLVVIGFFLLAALAVFTFVMTIIGLVKAIDGKIYKFPVAFKFIS